MSYHDYLNYTAAIVGYFQSYIFLNGKHFSLQNSRPLHAEELYISELGSAYIEYSGPKI